MKYLLFIIPITAFIFSCGNPELEKKVQQLEKENAELNEELENEVSDQQEVANQFYKSIQEIEENIDELDMQQGALKIDLLGGIENTQTGKDRILLKIQLIF